MVWCLVKRKHRVSADTVPYITSSTKLINRRNIIMQKLLTHSTGFLGKLTVTHLVKKFTRVRH